MKLTAIDLMPHPSHQQALLLDGGFAGEDAADAHSVEMAAVAGYLDL